MKLFELFADLGLQTDGFEKGVKSATKQGSAFASAISSNFTSISARAVALGNAMYDVSKQLTKMSVDAVKSIITEYSDTEQLVGGVETLFKDSADQLIEYADEAFRTAGLSANEYMEQAVSFSATLLQGLGGDTEKAVEYADLAMRDMSDNANKFGTDIGMIQNAYQGFAKDNYTMLDNLKLGYGGTQEEMARLVNESGVLGDSIKVTAETVKDVPFDQIIQAIHVIQERLEITGTTTKEATETVSGSIASFQAAWSNLLSGMASDDKEMDELIDNVFETGENVARNILNLLPNIWDNTLESINSLLDQWDLTSTLKQAYSEEGWRGVWDEATKIVEESLEKLGPMALDSGSQILANILSGITGDTVSSDQIKATLVNLWNDGNAAVTSFVENAGGVLSGIYEGFTGQEATKENIIATLKGLFDDGQSALSDFLGNAKGLLSGIYEGMSQDSSKSDDISSLLGKMFSEGLNAASKLKENATGLLGSIYTAITGQEATANNIGKTIGGVFSAGVDAAAGVMETATTFFNDLADTLGDPDASIGEKIAGIFDDGTDAIGALMEEASDFSSDLYEALTGDSEGAEKVKQFFEGLFAIPNAILNPETIAPEYTGSDAWNDVWEQNYLQMAQTMYASPREYGITEAQADEWITILRRYDSGDEYTQAIQAIVSAWESYESTRESDDESDDALSSAVQEMSLAAQALQSAGEKLSGMSAIDGSTLVSFVSASMSRNTRGARYTG